LSSCEVVDLIVKVGHLIGVFFSVVFVGGV
jgi:hypothetical protein